jgi:hypothetical protein
VKVKSIFFVRPLNMPGPSNSVQQLNINETLTGAIKGQAKQCIRADGGYYVYFPAGVNAGWHHIPDAFVQSARCEPDQDTLNHFNMKADGTPFTEEERKEWKAALASAWAAECASPSAAEQLDALKVDINKQITEAGIKSEAALEYEAQQAPKTSGAHKTKKSNKPARA